MSKNISSIIKHHKSFFKSVFNTNDSRKTQEQKSFIHVYSCAIDSIQWVIQKWVIIHCQRHFYRCSTSLKIREIKWKTKIIKIMVTSWSSWHTRIELYSHQTQIGTIMIDSLRTLRFPVCSSLAIWGYIQVKFRDIIYSHGIRIKCTPTGHHRNIVDFFGPFLTLRIYFESKFLTHRVLVYSQIGKRGLLRRRQRSQHFLGIRVYYKCNWQWLVNS